MESTRAARERPGAGSIGPAESRALGPSRGRLSAEGDVPGGCADVVGPALPPAPRLIRAVLVAEVGTDRVHDQPPVAALEDERPAREGVHGRAGQDRGGYRVG